MNYGLDTAGEKEKRTSKKNMDGRSTSSHDNKRFRIRAMEKQRGMAFGFRETTTAVKKTGQTDRQNSRLHTEWRWCRCYSTISQDGLTGFVDHRILKRTKYHVAHTGFSENSAISVCIEILSVLLLGLGTDGQKRGAVISSEK